MTREGCRQGARTTEAGGSARLAALLTGAPERSTQALRADRGRRTDFPEQANWRRRSPWMIGKRGHGRRPLKGPRRPGAARGRAVPAVVSWPRRRRISSMALSRSPLVSQNWGEQPEYSQAPTAPVGAGHTRSLCRPGPAAPPRALLAGARTQQHHEVPEAPRSALSRPGPLHVGHAGPPGLQHGELVVAGGRSVNTHTSRLVPGRAG